MLKVSDLQQLIAGLAAPLQNAGASQKVIDEIARLGACLEPFQQKGLGEFADFLQMADNYVRTGTLPSSASAGSSRKSTPKAPKVSVEDAAQKVLELYERAIDPATDYATIDAGLALLAPLTVAQIKSVAEQARIGIPGNVKKKDEILKKIALTIKDRKAIHERTQFREPSPSSL